MISRGNIKMYNNGGLFDQAENSVGVSCNLVHIV